MSKSGNIFLTGITGVLGKELVKELYSTTTSKFFLLVRGNKKQTYVERTTELLKGLDINDEPGQRIVIMEGDVSFDGFGLSEDDRETLRKNVNIFYHIAALTNLNASEEESDRINVGGVLNALEIAEDIQKNGKLDNFFYFSTAYVVGSAHEYTSKEDELPEHPAHANFYESSKFKAETNVRKKMAEGFPITIFRPSIVVGNSVTGAVSEFNVIYPFIRLFLNGELSTIVTRAENTCNVVPIDFVINATCEIVTHDNIKGKTFHLVSPDPPSLSTVLKITEEETDVKFPDYKVVDPDDFKVEDLTEDEVYIYRKILPFRGYLNGELVFNMENTKKELEGTKVQLPVTDYNFIKTLYNYAVDVGYFKLRKA